MRPAEVVGVLLSLGSRSLPLRSDHHPGTGFELEKGEALASSKTPMVRRYLTPAEAAEYMGYSRRTIYEIVPQLKHYRIGPAGSLRFLVEDLDAFMESQAVQPVMRE
jgi:excisionase family DNA binding protein